MELWSDSDAPFGLPDPSAYIKLVKKQLSTNRSRLGMPIAGPNLDDWNKLRSLQPADNVRPILLRIAQKLREYPRLLYGVNCLIQPRYRVECSTTTAEVKHFVLVDQASRYSEMYSFVDHMLVISHTSQSIQELMQGNPEWESAVGASADGDWLACVAQILQEMIHHPPNNLSKPDKLLARTRLHRLAKAGFLPPSSFIHFVEPNIPQFDSMIEYSTSGGFCDAHKITINKVPLCFRVLRQWESSDSGKKVYKEFCRELSVWQQLRYPNILSLMGATTEAFPGRYCFLVPWLSNGPITSYLKSQPYFTPPVGHKDLRGDNVLVRHDLVCVITDFGLASVLETQRTTTAGRGNEFEDEDEDDSIGLEIEPLSRPGTPTSDSRISLKNSKASMVPILRDRRVVAVDSEVPDECEFGIDDRTPA
ncbi:hypothetical protein CPB83DRAFT_896460 [Crepidotus variabilis]|uniref:Serine-threonine/tyrosine-protein kinase catalytic domain-containing protein n=1 Tax=Crepidotus variabilis TaxID=179855 RepID=A0A9P6EBR6_9AGAR|nr:hypothetical protein CPB83DRAFT_896460 [Crepidotus variabilis]